MAKMVEALPGASATAIKRFQAAALGVAMNPLIVGCTPESVFTAIYTCARLNLIPDPALKHAHIVPFKDKGVPKAQLIIGYQGYIELARRANPALIVRTGSVYENDEYQYEDGMELVFKVTKRAWEKGMVSGKFLFSYCISGTSGQEKMVKIVSRQDGVKIASTKSDYTPWKKGGTEKESGVAVDFPAMCEKTAIRASSKLWSLDPEKEETKQFMEALHMDENQDAPEVGDLNEYGLNELENEDAGAPLAAPNAGNVKAGKVEVGTKVTRRATADEVKRLWSMLGDKLQDAGLEPSVENSNVVMGLITKGVPIENANIGDVIEWSTKVTELDITKLGAALRGG